jgi:hypothetical protein
VIRGVGAEVAAAFGIEIVRCESGVASSLPIRCLW